MQKELVEGIVDEFRRVVENFLREVEEGIRKGSVGSLEAWEEAVRDRVQPIQRRMLEALLERLGTGQEGSRRACGTCGGWARYMGNRPHRVQTVVGRLREHRRAYYYGCRCEGGFFPQDQKLGLDREGRSPGLVRLLSLAGAASSYEKAAEYLWEIGRLATSRTTIERVTEEQGEQAQAYLRARETQGRAGLLKEVESPPKRLYIEIDGTCAPTREGWKEVKLGCVFEQQGEQRTKAHYTAGFEGVEDFLPRLKGVALVRGLAEAQEVVVLGDGAAWIWGRVPEVLDRPVKQIVDWYHAKERIYRIATLCFGETSPEGKAWARQAEAELWEGRVEDVLHRIRQLRPRGSEAKTWVRQSLGYFAENAERMRYGSFRAEGYWIGSGVVESGCKHVVGERLKQAGMRWEREHADKVLALRVLRASGLWERFWEHKRLRAA